MKAEHKSFEAAAGDGESQSEIPRKINIVLNWFEELKERIPVD